MQHDHTAGIGEQGQRGIAPVSPDAIEAELDDDEEEAPAASLRIAKLRGWWQGK